MFFFSRKKKRPPSWPVIAYQIGSAFTAARLVRQSALAGHFPAVLGQLWGRGTKAPVPALISQCQCVSTSATGRSRPAAAPLHLPTLTVVRDRLPGFPLDLIAVIMILAGNFSDLVRCLALLIRSARSTVICHDSRPILHFPSHVTTRRSTILARQHGSFISLPYSACCGCGG